MTCIASLISNNLLSGIVSVISGWTNASIESPIAFAYAIISLDRE
ncbi:MAG: hypothetical protein WCW01_02130 [Gammaproteobacteria bacterium]